MLFVARLILPMFHGHSVLAGSIGLEHRPTAEALVFMAGSLIGFVLESSQIVFYAIALFATARMVRRVAPRSSPAEPSTGRAIAALSMRALLAALGLGIANSVILWAVMKTRWHALAPWWVVSVVISAVTMSVFAYVMVPPALRFLADPMESPDKRSIQLGRKCAVAAVITSAVVMILEHIAIGAIYGRHAEILGVGAIASLIAALPYAPLYIALSLLTGNEQTDVPQEHPVPVPTET